MFIQTQKTPNPNSIKFLPGKKVSLVGPVEILKKEDTDNYLLKNILSIEGVTGIFLSEDYISVNKNSEKEWEELKHIIQSFINEYYQEGNESVISKNNNNSELKYKEIEKKIISVLENKIRPAVARDGGDIRFKEFKNGVVKVQLQGSCSGCPSSTITLKQGVKNLLCHYIHEVKQVEAE